MVGLVLLLMMLGFDAFSSLLGYAPRLAPELPEQFAFEVYVSLYKVTSAHVTGELCPRRTAYANVQSESVKRRLHVCVCLLAVLELRSLWLCPVSNPVMTRAEMIAAG